MAAALSSGPLLRSFLSFPIVHGWEVLRQPQKPPSRQGPSNVDWFCYQYVECHRPAINGVLRHFNCSINIVIGRSMLPTFTDDCEIAWFDHHHAGGRDIHAGDVVDVWAPETANRGGRWIKRVMGLEGDVYIKKTPLRGMVERVKVSKRPLTR